MEKNYTSQDHYDVAIIGGGPAGLAAAIEAAEAGCHVALYERRKNVGGARDGGCGFFGVESSVQKKENNPLTKQEAFEFMMEHSHWKANARLVSQYISFSASTVEWMKDKIGLPITHTSGYFPGAAATIHNYADFRKIKITELLRKRAAALNVHIFCHHSVCSLAAKDGFFCYDGTDEAGIPFAGKAKAVISAAGGFGGNPELVQGAGYTAGQDLMYTFDLSDMDGSGLRMLWTLGAKKAPMMMDTYMGLAQGYGGPMGTAPKLSALRQPCNLMVNQKGYRFMREDLVSNPGYAGCAIHSQYNGCGIMLLDENLYQNLPQDLMSGPGGPPPDGGTPKQNLENNSSQPYQEESVAPEPFDRFTGTMEEIMVEAMKAGSKDFFIAESLEDFAAQADIPYANLKETLEEYNAMCMRGEDSVFYKNPEYLKPITGPKFYGARFFCDTYGGLGGIQVDYKMRVLDQNEDPIPGLFAAGNDANTIFGECYPFYMAGNTSGFALNTGRMAGIAAAKYVEAEGSLWS